MYKDQEKKKANARKCYLKYRGKTRDKSNERNRRVKQANKEFIAIYLSEHPCVDCGNNNPIVLEFDHIKDKCRNVSDLVCRGFGLHRVKEEVEKCEVRCANCHRIKTHQRRKEAKIAATSSPE